MTDTPTTPAEPEVVADVPMIEKEKYMRLAADFENYKKVQDQTMQTLGKYAGQSVITDMLDAVDMVEAAVAHAPEMVKAEKQWFGGLEQVGKQFLERMKRYGLERIATGGKLFDPATMEAIQMKPPDSPEKSGIVEQEVRAGYTMHDRVIRPARVIVYQ